MHQLRCALPHSPWGRGKSWQGDGYQSRADLEQVSATAFVLHLAWAAAGALVAVLWVSKALRW